MGLGLFNFVTPVRPDDTNAAISNLLRAREAKAADARALEQIRSQDAIGRMNADLRAQENAAQLARDDFAKRKTAGALLDQYNLLRQTNPGAAKAMEPTLGLFGLTPLSMPAYQDQPVVSDGTQPEGAEPPPDAVPAEAVAPSPPGKTPPVPPGLSQFMQGLAGPQTHTNEDVTMPSEVANEQMRLLGSEESTVTPEMEAAQTALETVRPGRTMMLYQGKPIGEIGGDAGAGALQADASRLAQGYSAGVPGEYKAQILGMLQQAKTPEEVQAMMKTLGAPEILAGIRGDNAIRAAEVNKRPKYSGGGGGAGAGVAKDTSLANEQIQRRVQDVENRQDTKGLFKTVANGEEIASMAGSADSMQQRVALIQQMHAWFGSAITESEKANLMDAKGKLERMRIQLNAYAQKGELPPEFVSSFREAVNMMARIKQDRINKIADTTVEALGSDPTLMGRIPEAQRPQVLEYWRSHMSGNPVKKPGEAGKTKRPFEL